MAERGIFLFRRDLRLQDNTGLNRALRECDQVALVFVLDPQQIERHPYFSAPALRFMLESLEDLERALQRAGGRLYVAQGDPSIVVPGLAQALKASVVHANRDYTPFSRERDQTLGAGCRRVGADLILSGDILLNEPEDLQTTAGGPYRVFTPFRNAARGRKVPATENRPRGASSHGIFRVRATCRRRRRLRRGPHPVDAHVPSRSSSVSAASRTTRPVGTSSLRPAPPT